MDFLWTQIGNYNCKQEKLTTANRLSFIIHFNQLLDSLAFGNKLSYWGWWEFICPRFKSALLSIVYMKPYATVSQRAAPRWSRRAKSSHSYKIKWMLLSEAPLDNPLPSHHHPSRFKVLKEQKKREKIHMAASTGGEFSSSFRFLVMW